MKTIIPGPQSLLEQAQEKLGDALALDVLREEAENPGDKEGRRYLLHDLNSLLADCRTMETFQPHQLNNPELFRMQLRECLETPAQVLVQEHPNRLRKWLAEEPPEKSPERQTWAASGRSLLNAARLNG